MNASMGTSLVRLNYAVAAWCVLTAGDDFRRSLKAGFQPDEPRIPAGSPAQANGRMAEAAELSPGSEITLTLLSREVAEMAMKGATLLI